MGPPLDGRRVAWRGVGANSVPRRPGWQRPIGWRPGNQEINGLSGLNIGTNLGFGERVAWTSVTLWENYLHPAVFVLPFVPFLVWGWRRIDGRLKVICLTLTPLVLLSNLCFGWMYESRNYVPLLPLQATMVLQGIAHPSGWRSSSNRALP